MRVPLGHVLDGLLALVFVLGLVQTASALAGHAAIQSLREAVAVELETFGFRAGTRFLRHEF